MKKTKNLDYTLKNNYLFISLMNESMNSLKMLICSLLGYDKEEIHTIQIRNPIKRGQAVDDKTFILDVAVLLNDNTYLNIELQIDNYGNWPERSVGYLCRSYDHLNRGDDYIETKNAIHISILDFTLFKDAPEFFASYRLLNVKNHREYTGKFQLYVLDLTHMELATQNDIDNNRHIWAKIFQAKTWGDLMAIAEQYQDFQPIVDDMEKIMADDRIRLQCDAEERVRNRERAIKKKLAKQEALITEQITLLADKDNQLANKNNQLADKDNQLADQTLQLANKDKLIEELQKKLAMYEK